MAREAEREHAVMTLEALGVEEKRRGWAVAAEKICRAGEVDGGGPAALGGEPKTLCALQRLLKSGPLFSGKKRSWPSYCNNCSFKNKVRLRLEKTWTG